VIVKPSRIKAFVPMKKIHGLGMEAAFAQQKKA